MTRLPDRVVTERLVLRRWDPADEPALSRAIAASLEHLRPWMPWAAGEPLGPAARVHWIDDVNRQWERGGDVVLGILLDGSVVGGTGLHRRSGPDTLEVGYWVHVDHTGRGYASEATAALTGAAFTVPGIEYVEVHHDRANVASRRIPERLGFSMVAEREPTTVASPGEERVDCCWRMARDDWSAPGLSYLPR